MQLLKKIFYCLIPFLIVFVIEVMDDFREFKTFMLKIERNLNKAVIKENLYYKIINEHDYYEYNDKDYIDEGKLSNYLIENRLTNRNGIIYSYKSDGIEYTDSLKYEYLESDHFLINTPIGDTIYIFNYRDKSILADDFLLMEDSYGKIRYKIKGLGEMLILALIMSVIIGIAQFSRIKKG